MFARPSLGAIAFGFVAAAVSVTVVLGAIMLVTNNDRAGASQAVARQTRSLTLYESARAAALTETTHLAGYVIMRDPRSLDALSAASSDVDRSLSQLQETGGSGDEASRARSLAATHAELSEGYLRAVNMSARGDFEGIVELGNEGLATAAVEFLEDLRIAVADARASLLRAQDDAKGTEARADAITLAIVAAWCLLGIAAGAGLRLAVARPLNDLAHTARRIAIGDTSQRAAETGAVEVANLGRDVNRMAEALLTRSEALAAHGAELEEANRRLAELLESERQRARRDPLTGALNHGALAEELRLLISSQDARGAFVAMVDVNGLKDINDTFGHQTGDEVLRRVASALGCDGAIVGRYGGDEFVALLTPCTASRAGAYKDAVQQAMEASGFLDEHTGARVTVSASIGMAAYPAEGTRIEEILSRADSAMYADKRQRPLEPGAGTGGGVIDDELATRMIGELVPLLASAATLDAKLGIIAQRLSQGTGYMGATFDVFERGAEAIQDRSATLSTNAFADADEEMMRRWRDEQRTVYNHPIAPVIREHMRPVIIDELATTPYITEEQRTILNAAGIQSGIVLPLVWQGEWIGTMAVGSRQLAAFTPRDAHFLATVAGHASAIVQSERMVEELRLASHQLATSHGETVMMLAASVEAHDETTGRHLVRVRELTQSLAVELGCEPDTAHAMATASVLHDIGKVRVPDTILKSPDRLSEDEWRAMKQHTVWGAEFLASHAGFELASEIARAHHERWDGSGYPHGLVGEAIPLSAQIVSVADAFDAMTSDRPYRMGRSARSAVREVFTHSGTQFSPAVVAALLRLYRRGALPAQEEPRERVAA